MKNVRLVALFSFAAACSSWSPPTPPPGAPGAPPPETTQRNPADDSIAPAPERFAKIRDKALDDMLADDPSLARDLGIHEYDGKVADVAPASIQKRIERLERVVSALDHIDRKALSPDEALDLELIKSDAEGRLFRAVDLDSWEKNPRWYEDVFDVGSYVNRDYAPIDERAKKLIEHEKAAIPQVKNILSNLKGPMSKAVVEVSIKIYKGYASYLRGDVLAQMKGAGSAELQKELADRSEELAKGADAVAAFLEKELPRGDQSHILGAERFQKLLRTQEGLSISLGEFKKMGEENLAANKKDYDALKSKAKLTRPRAADLMKVASKLTEDARLFVIDKKVATIPTTEQAVVKETPPYMRWNGAFLNPPGPFEAKPLEAFFYITLPDPTWSKKDQEDYITPLGILMSTTVHEVYPGHFLQGQWRKRAPTRAQKIFSAYSFQEGWAHYGEQVMVELGFLAKDPQNKLGQLSDALLRNCRFVVSLGIHTEGMTLDQAAKRFEDDCHQDKVTAREQALRGTFDPGYFAYTLGKIQILALRDEAKKKLGDKFDLQKFHDALLAHGTPPVPLIHDRVLADLGAH